MGELGEVIKSISKPAEKLIDAIRAAIGVAYEPHHHKKMTEAEVYRTEEYLRIIRENSDLPIEYKGGDIRVNIVDSDALVKRTGCRIAYQELYKQQNLETVFDKAIDVLDDKQVASDEEILPEWMIRFINLAGEISTEEMQDIWSRVLVGEVLDPGSFSMKTLSVLRSMSANDAKLFSGLSRFIISERFLFQDYSLNSKFGFSYNDILSMDEIGLINSDGEIHLSVEVGQKPQVLMEFGDYLLLASSKKTMSVRFNHFPLSRAGRELLSVVMKRDDSDKMPNDYMMAVVGVLKKKYDMVKFEIHIVLARDGDRITFDDNEYNP